MNIEIVISSAVVSAIVAAIGSVAAALIARKTAKDTAQQEFEKLRRTWAHEEQVSYDQAFREMVEAVTQYLQDSSWTKQEQAKVKTMNALSLSSGSLADRIGELYDCLKYRPAVNGEECLKAVIACKQSPQKESRCFLCRLLRE